MAISHSVCHVTTRPSGPALCQHYRGHDEFKAAQVSFCMYMYLYVHVSNTTLFRPRENEAESFNEASEIRTDYLQHYIQIFLIPFIID